MKTRIQKSRWFEKFLLEELRDPKLAAAYLNEHFTYRGPKRQELLLQAIKDVVQAQGFTKLARQSGLSRRTLYKAFSRDGNPTVETLLGLLDAVGIAIQFESTPRQRKAA
jgi:probable addiction module antidote protein